MNETINSVIHKTEQYFKAAEKANREIAFRYWTHSDKKTLPEKETSLALFKELLKENPAFVMVYFSDTEGNMIMGRRMPDHSLSKRYVTREGEWIRTKYVHENKEYNAIYPGSLESPETGYDPRSREWYKMAEKEKKLIWTNVYIFASDKLPGFTCSLPIYRDDGSLLGMACVDIEIRNISLFLGDISLTPNARLFIVDQKNQIIANPISNEDSFDSLFHIYKKNGKEVWDFKKIDNPEDAVIYAFYEKLLQKKEEEKLFTYKANGKEYFSTYSNLNLGTSLNLKIGMIIPDEDIMGTVYRNNKIILTVAIFIVLLAIAISFFLSSVISRPMRILSLEMNKIKRFAIEDAHQIKSAILEIDKIVNSFGGMKRGLTNFKKYVPSDVVNILIQNEQDADIGGEEQELTIFFSDIENFTNISESITPENLLSQLCEYFSSLSYAILEHKGTLDKYIGDSIMAFWGAPIPLTDHAFLACQSALICKDLSFNLSHTWEREGKPRFHTRIGIHTGKVIVGNMGSEERINYTVIGDNVNLASRLEGINKYYGTEILTSEDTYQQVKEQFEFRTLDRIRVKGKTKPVTIYELLAEKNRLSRQKMKLYKVYETGVYQYFNGNWKKAVRCMDFVLGHIKDRPAAIIRDRSLTYLKNPPTQWNGVHIFNDK